MEKLEPPRCQCGGEARYRGDAGADIGWIWIECNKCEKQGLCSIYRDPADEAAADAEALKNWEAGIFFEPPT